MEFSLERLSFVYSMIGPAGTFLVLLALAALYLTIWQLVYMSTVWRNFRREYPEIEKLGAGVTTAGEPGSDNPLFRIVWDIVTKHSSHSDDIRAEVGYLFHRNFKKVANDLCWLKLIAVVSPLMGLLGTVWGMVAVFQGLSEASQANAAVLASGIWSALVTTIMGLVIAVPTLFVYYFLTLKFRGFRIEAIEYSYRALSVCFGIRRGGANS